MKNNDLFELLQNSVVGALAMHSFTLGFYQVARHKPGREKFPYMDYFFYVLPIVYNHDALEVVKGSNELYTVLLKDNSVILGLQDRANKMSPKTFDSLNMAFSKKFLTINLETKTIETTRGFQSRKLPLPKSMSSDDNSVKKIQDCAFKLGSIFAKRNPANIQYELNIRF